MRKVPKATYLSADEIEQLLKQRETEAAAMPKGPKRQAIPKEIAQLHMYAATKRWFGHEMRKANRADAAEINSSSMRRFQVLRGLPL